MKELARKLDRATEQEIKDYQSDALRQHINYLYEYSEYYRTMFDEQNIDPESIRSVDDLVQCPTTDKEVLEKENERFIATNPIDIVEYVTTSGTLGKPITIALTKNDLDRLAYNEARSLEIAGIGKEDIVQITTTLDKRFMAGMAYYLGTVSLGAKVIRTGIGNPGFQWENILRFHPTVLIGVPSFVYKLQRYASEMGLNPGHSSVKKSVCIGEPLRNPDLTPSKLAEKIRERWDIRLHSTYASTEMMTAFTECEAGRGGHLIPELIIVEILDENGMPVGPGELGEVTVTPLGIEGMPLLRYRTGDLARLHPGNCECGRTTPRIGPIEGRKKQMIKLKGTTIFPQAIENVLQNFENADLYVIELSNSSVNTDRVNIYLADKLPASLIDKIKDALNDHLRVSPEITLVPEKDLLNLLFPQGSRKPMKILDKRTSR